MSTVVPSNGPEPISRCNVAERRSGAICHAALRTRAGSICSSVCARAKLSRSVNPSVGATAVGGVMMIPAAAARCRAIGSRRRSSSRLQRASSSGTPSAASPDGDSRASRCSSLCSSESSRWLRGCLSLETGGSGDARARRVSRWSRSAKRGSRVFRGGMGRRDCGVGMRGEIFITHVSRTAGATVARKATGGVR